MTANNKSVPLNTLFLKDINAEPTDVDETIKVTNEVIEGDNDEPNPSPQFSNTEEETYKKRYDDIKTYLNRKEDSFKSELNEKDEKLRLLNEELAAFKNAEKLKGINEPALNAWKEKNPEMYDLFVSIARKEGISTVEDLDKHTSKIENKIKQIEEREALAEIMEIHPDALGIRESNEFVEWYKKQSRGIQGLFADGATPTDVVEGLTLYKNKMGIKTETNRSRKGKAAQTVDTKEAVEIVDNSDKDLIFESQLLKDGFYEANKEKVDKAEREGRIVLDISGRRRR
jgi:hypothetical protein